MWPAQLATHSTRQWLVQNASVHGGGRGVVMWLAQLATLTTRHVLTTGWGGYEDPTSLHLGLSGQMGQYIDCQFLGHAIVNKMVGIAVEKVVYGFPSCL